MNKTLANLDAEKTLLGAIFRDKEIIDEVSNLLTQDDFYDNRNGAIFRTILELDAENIVPDLVSVSAKAANISAIYIAELITYSPTAANASYYAKQIREYSLLRKASVMATRISNKIYDGDYESAEELVAEAERYFYELGQGRGTELYRVKDNVLGYIQSIEERKPGITGLEMPFKRFEYMTNGLQRKDLIVIAARPSMGKTSLLTEIATFAALEGKGVAFFSLEMSKEQILNRIFVQHCLLNGSKFRIGNLDGNEWNKVNRLGERLHKSNFVIEDASVTTVPEMRLKCRAIKRRDGLDLIVIDYLQLIKCHRKVGTRDQEITEIATSLKALAKELDVPVVALAQLSRSVENRQDKHPQMSDLRESGGIENNADVIAFIYREEYYNAETLKQGIAEIIIAKQREGPTGSFELAWEKEFTKFSDI